jgi:nucleoside-diphosphate-sugar epimerase
MKVAISGASSYTGACIAEAFGARGHVTTALCPAELASYGGLKRLRLDRIVRAGVELVCELRAEDGSMADFLRSRRFDVWVHHHHAMERFRAPDYDMARARTVGLAPLDGIVGALTGSGARAVLLSGTYFEPGEGGRPSDAPSTPYAQSKRELAEALATRSAKAGLSFAKIVIPTPSGALENGDRLTPLLIAAAEKRVPFPLRSPASVMDVIPGEALAEVYVRAADAALDSSAEAPVTYRPSGRVVTAIDWAETLRTELLRPLALDGALALDIPDVSEQTPPVVFRNPASEALAIDWATFFSRYAREWQETRPFR